MGLLEKMYRRLLKVTQHRVRKSKLVQGGERDDGRGRLETHGEEHGGRAQGGRRQEEEKETND